MRGLLSLLLLLPTLAVAAPQAPTPTAAGLCEPAIVMAERDLNLPSRVLFAIAEVESGRLDASGVVRPWPWTINAEGRGEFFASKADAIAAVRALQLKGVRSIDVGCMQVNLMHHPNAFASLDEAFEPSHNALYAARFLNALYGASGSWLQAVAAYHSETPAIGADYQRRVVARWQGSGMAGWRPAHAAYRDFAPTSPAYRDFQPSDRVYGAFATNPVPVADRLARR